MEFQPSQQDVNELINVMFHDELQYFNASFDIVKNEVIPSIAQSLESLQRAEQEYRNGQVYAKRELRQLMKMQIM